MQKCKRLWHHKTVFRKTGIFVLELENVWCLGHSNHIFEMENHTGVEYQLIHKLSVCLSMLGGSFVCFEAFTQWP